MTTPEGVRIEFQQLPGEAAPRLRLIVDASQLLAQVPQPAFNTAFVRLEEERDDGGTKLPDRHILVVALNAAGRGFTDFVLGPSQEGVDAEGAPDQDDPFVLPAPHVGFRLAGATLAHLPTAPASEAA